MIGIFDVGYGDASALVGVVLLDEFEDARAASEYVVEAGPVEPYVPGEFWRRELAPLLRAVHPAIADLSVCVIDAYVDLGRARRPGLGRMLHVSTGLPVIGVAKSFYPDTPREYEVRRGSSRRPLYVSAAGFDLDEAKRCIVRMAGDARVPTMFRRADELSKARRQ